MNFVEERILIKLQKFIKNIFSVSKFMFYYKNNLRVGVSHHFSLRDEK
jgi:hypothetical protein